MWTALLAFIVKYWKPAGLVLLVGALIGWESYHLQQARAQGYKLGQAETAAKYEKKLAALEARRQEQARIAEQKLLELQETERVQYVNIPKIVEKPVYRNVCIDDDGLRELNKTINQTR